VTDQHGGAGHGHVHADGSMHLTDPDANVTALATDLSYFRRKRLESRVLHLARRGIVPFADLLRAHAALPPPAAVPPPDDVDDRIAAAQTRLDALVTAIASLGVPHRTGPAIAIDDTRRERGDYDPWFRLAVREHGGDLHERLAGVEQELADSELLVRALERALVDTGRVTTADLEARRRDLESLGYRNGARLVARAWTDPAFKRRLLETGREAVRELDIPPGKLGQLGVAENTVDVHNVVVCTLCSCYPHDLLGNPPWWYRTDTYKRRIIADPRPALAELFGLELAPDVVLRVHDSTSDRRWMVLPARPAGTEGWSEDRLAELVTAESMVGAEVLPDVTGTGAAT
jgi:nitrile hydratase subunit alpha